VPAAKTFPLLQFHLENEMQNLDVDSEDLAGFCLALQTRINAGSEHVRDLLLTRGRHYVIERVRLRAVSVVAKWVESRQMGDFSLNTEENWSRDLYLVKIWMHFHRESKYLFVAILEEIKEN
jgi:hypothetical protein